MDNYSLCQIVKDGRKVMGYIIQSDGSTACKSVNKEALVKLIQNKQVTNCGLQLYQGSYIIRPKKNANIAITPYSEYNNNYSRPVEKTVKAQNKTVATNRDKPKAVKKEKKTDRIVGNNIADKIARSILTDRVSKETKGKILCGKDAVSELLICPNGTPFKVKITSYGDFKQCILLDNARYKTVPSECKFKIFDGDGVNGYFEFSMEFLNRHDEIKFKFDDNDPSEVQFLLNYIKKGPFGLGNLNLG